MSFLHTLVELLKDPRTAIAGWIAMGIAPTLGFIFLILFIETGVVIMPFLPGDSLLFAAGYFAHDARSGLTLWMLLPVVLAAPILGDECNYFIGRFFGKRILESGKVKALTPERIEKTSGMIEKWGPLAVFLGRFFPIIRTFMPFISGMSGMKWHRFAPFSVLGGLIWGTLFTLLGYFFGGIPAVQKHFELVILLILVISLAPTIIAAIRGLIAKRRAKPDDATAPAAANDAETAESLGNAEAETVAETVLQTADGRETEEEVPAAPLTTATGEPDVLANALESEVSETARMEVDEPRTKSGDCGTPEERLRTEGSGQESAARSQKHFPHSWRTHSCRAISLRISVAHSVEDAL